MKICLINTTTFWGGGEKWFFQNAVFLAQSGFEVQVLAHKDGALWQKLSGKEGIHLNHLEVGNLSFINPKKKWALRSFFARVEPRVVLMNSSPEVKLCAPAAKKAAVPHIVYRRGSAITVKGSKLNKELYGKVITQVIANSQATKATFLQHLQPEVDAQKVHVIPNGIQLPADVATQEQTVFTIGTLGRLVHQKGMDLALDTAVLLKKSGLDFKWLIAGGGADHDALQQKLEEKELTDFVTLLGEISDVTAFFNSIDLYVHTARWEGFGFAIAEAMAHKKAVLGFDISSNPELIEDNVTGKLVPMEDLEMLAEEVRSLANDAETRALLGAAGRSAIERSFTVTRQQKRLLSFLQSL